MEFAAKNCQMQVMPMNMLMSSMPFSVEGIPVVHHPKLVTVLKIVTAA